MTWINIILTVGIVVGWVTALVFCNLAIKYHKMYWDLVRIWERTLDRKE